MSKTLITKLAKNKKQAAAVPWKKILGGGAVLGGAGTLAMLNGREETVKPDEISVDLGPEPAPPKVKKQTEPGLLDSARSGVEAAYNNSRDFLVGKPGATSSHEDLNAKMMDRSFADKGGVAGVVRRNPGTAAGIAGGAAALAGLIALYKMRKQKKTAATFSTDGSVSSDYKKDTKLPPAPAMGTEPDHYREAASRPNHGMLDRIGTGINDGAAWLGKNTGVAKLTGLSDSTAGYATAGAGAAAILGGLLAYNLMKSKKNRGMKVAAFPLARVESGAIMPAMRTIDATVIKPSRKTIGFKPSSKTIDTESVKTPDTKTTKPTDTKPKEDGTVSQRPGIIQRNPLKSLAAGTAAGLAGGVVLGRTTAPKPGIVDNVKEVGSKAGNSINDGAAWLGKNTGVAKLTGLDDSTAGYATAGAGGLAGIAALYWAMKDKKEEPKMAAAIGSALKGIKIPKPLFHGALGAGATMAGAGAAMGGHALAKQLDRSANEVADYNLSKPNLPDDSFLSWANRNIRPSNSAVRAGALAGAGARALAEQTPIPAIARLSRMLGEHVVAPAIKAFQPKSYVGRGPDVQR